MMRLICLMLVGLLLFPTIVWAASPQDYTITYVHEEKEPQRESLTTMNLKYYVSNDQKLRIDYLSASAAVQMSRIFQRDQGLIWTLYSFANQYQEESFDQSQWEALKGGFAFEWEWDKCQKTGETKILNYPCDIYQMQQNAKTTTAYIAQEMNIVLKAEIEEDGKIVFKLEATDFQPQEKTAASFFELPDGYTKGQW